MKNKLIFLLSLIIINLSLIQTVSASIEDIHGMEFVKQYSSSPRTLFAMDVYDYIENSTGSKFKVQILEFYEKEKLDYWIEGKIENSFEQRIINNQVIFLDEYKNYLFWKKDIKFIQIINIRYDKIDKEAIYDNFKTEGPGVFPENLVREFLLEYPSDCYEGGCFSPEGRLDRKLRKDLEWFLDPPIDLEDYDYYAIDNGCPTSEEEWDELKDSPSLDDWEIEELRKQCEKYPPLELPRELMDCLIEMEDYLNKQGIERFDGDMLLEECILRERFTEEFNYDGEYIELVFEERNKVFLRDIEFINQLHEELRSGVVIRNKDENVVTEEKFDDNKEIKESIVDNVSDDETPKENLESSDLEQPSYEYNKTKINKLIDNPDDKKNDNLKEGGYTSIFVRVFKLIANLFN